MIRTRWTLTHSVTVMTCVSALIAQFVVITAPTLAQQSVDMRKPRVVVDPTDKQNLTGFASIAIVWGEQLNPPNDLTRGVLHLSDAMNQWTKVETTMERHLMLSSERLLTTPFIFVTTTAGFELSSTERANLKKFFDAGGVAFLDNASPNDEFSASSASLKKMIRDVLPNARFEALTNSHPIYHSFFDFDDGAPMGSEVSGSTSYRSPQRPYLEGVMHNGRLVVLYSDKGYINKWVLDSNNDPQLRFGVNAVVFALLQNNQPADR